MIGIDADGVLYDYVTTCANFINGLLGDSVVDYYSCTDYDVLKAWGVAHLQLATDYHFSRTGVVSSMPVLNGAKEFINGVRTLVGEDFRIVTACPTSWHSERAESLYRDFGIREKNVIFTHLKHEIKLDILIDDWHENLRHFNGCRILLNAPWNQNTDGVDCTRVYSYQDALFMMRSYLEKQSLWAKDQLTKDQEIAKLLANVEQLRSERDEYRARFNASFSG